MRKIHLLDTSIATPNVGDEIIVERIRTHMGPILEDSYVTTSSAHDGLGIRSLGMARNADIILLLGANKLAHDFLRSTKALYISPVQLAALSRKVVLVGVGSYGYFDHVSTTQKMFLRQLLSRDYVHSVRDERALRILDECNIEGVNTSCPTLWDYRTKQPADAGGNRSAVSFSLTCFNKDPELDTMMVETLRSSYDRLIFWPQMYDDTAYLRELTSTNDIEIIPTNLIAYDRMLRSVQPDVVGTRLHGSIRALQFGCRILVVSVDNRATDIANETRLPCISREQVPDQLKSRIADLAPTELSLPDEEITRFLRQFRE